MKLGDKRRIALVLSGGGVKAAAFHIGVCLALQEKGFTFAGGTKEYVDTHHPDDERMIIRMYVGSSAGSVISSFLATGYSLDAVIDAFTQGAGISRLQTKSHPKKSAADQKLKPLNYRDIFSLNMSASSLAKVFPSLFRKKPVISGGIEVLLKQGVKVNGIFTTKGLEKYFRRHVYPDNRFSSLGVELYIVATQLNHSRKVVFGPYQETTKDKEIKYADYAHISEAIAASAALPPFFSPFGIPNSKGKKLYFFDGEIRDTLSTHVAADHGADLVIASYSFQPYHFNKDMGSLHEYGIPVIFNQALYQVVQQKIDSHIRHQKQVRSMMNAVKGYLQQIDIEDEHREKLLEILMERTNFKPDVDYLYIHPSPHDYEFFFADHFSLSPRILSQIVRTGFKSGMATLRHLPI